MPPILTSHSNLALFPSLLWQLYQHVMQLEDADRRAAGELPPEPEPEPPEPRPSPEQVRAAATARIWGALGREQLLVHVLSIRKGKVRRGRLVNGIGGMIGGSIDFRFAFYDWCL